MDEQLIQLDAIYDLPWNRIGPYLIGVITGYVLTIKLDGKLKIKKVRYFKVCNKFVLMNYDCSHI